MSKATEAIDLLVQLLVQPGSTRALAVAQLYTMNGAEIMGALENYERNHVTARGGQLKAD